MKKLFVLLLAAVAVYYGYEHFAKARSQGKNDPEFRTALEGLDGAIGSAKQAGRLDQADRMDTARGKALRAIEAGDKEGALALVRGGMRMAAASGDAATMGAPGGAEPGNTSGKAPVPGGGGVGGGSLLGQQLQAIDIQQTIQSSQVTPQIHGARQKARAAVESANRASRGTTGED